MAKNIAKNMLPKIITKKFRLKCTYMLNFMSIGVFDKEFTAPKSAPKFAQKNIFDNISKKYSK